MLEIEVSIERVFNFGSGIPYGLTREDFACLVRILVRARYARYIGVTIPMDKLLNEQPI